MVEHPLQVAAGAGYEANSEVAAAVLVGRDLCCCGGRLCRLLLVW